MFEAKILMSPEFPKFAEQIQEIQSEKAKLSEEFKVVYNTYTKNVKVLEDKALQLQNSMFQSIEGAKTLDIINSEKASEVKDG